MLNGTKPQPSKPEPKPEPPKQKKPKIDPGEVVFSFGKHKGKRIDEVPVQYLDWIHEWIANGDPDLQKKFNWLKATIEEYWEA
jgi:hypothetical protein